MRLWGVVLFYVFLVNLTRFELMILSCLYLVIYLQYIYVFFLVPLLCNRISCSLGFVSLKFIYWRCRGRSPGPVSCILRSTSWQHIKKEYSEFFLFFFCNTQIIYQTGTKPWPKNGGKSKVLSCLGLTPIKIRKT